MVETGHVEAPGVEEFTRIRECRQTAIVVKIPDRQSVLSPEQPEFAPGSGKLSRSSALSTRRPQLSGQGVDEQERTSVQQDNALLTQDPPLGQESDLGHSRIRMVTRIEQWCRGKARDDILIGAARRVGERGRQQSQTCEPKDGRRNDARYGVLSVSGR